MSLDPDDLSIDSFDPEPEQRDAPSMPGDDGAYAKNSADLACSPYCAISLDRACILY